MTRAFELALEAFKEHRDRYGLNQVRRSDDPLVVSENGVLFTVEYLMKLDSLVGSLEDLAEYMVEVKRVAEVFEATTWLPGLMRRFPGCIDQDSMDNHVARLSFDLKYNGGAFARDMIRYQKEQRNDGHAGGSKWWHLLAKAVGLGRARYSYNPVHPNLFHWHGWFGRSPGFIGLVNIAAYGSASLFTRFAFWVGTVVSALFTKKDDLDSWKLGYVALWGMRGRGLAWRFGEWIWKKRLLKFYPKGIVEVYARYYGVDHPIAKEY